MAPCLLFHKQPIPPLTHQYAMKPEVLFIETDPTFLRHLSSRLREHGIDVVEHLGVNGVLAQLHARRIHVVLMDMEKIKGEGISLIKSIKNTFPRTEFILLTQQEQVALSIEAMKIGFFEEIYLPLDIQLLVTSIIRAWKRRETKRASFGTDTPSEHTQQ